ncbi:MAG: hypothetical protein JW699_08600 [Chitinispirillaceae bacterium]|nr:hypothetical protein [Chitinispirillaceae bacterium]
MTRLFKPLLLIPLLCGSTPALTLSPGQQQHTERCIRAIINGEYDSAFAIADSAMLADTADPLASLLSLTAAGVRDIDFDSVLDSAAFFRAYRETERRIAVYEKVNGVSSYTKTLAGFCRGFLAASLLRESSYFAAMRNGLQSLGLLEEAYRLDRSNADPLFLLGLYEYAKGELKRRLRFVLFWYPGSKKTGIERLTYCMDNGHFAASPAAYALAEIYVREKMPLECGRLVERLAREFPESRFTMWAQAKYFESWRLFYEAGLMYELLAVSYAAERAGRYNSFLMRNLQAHMLLRAGQKKEAADSCRSILRETPAGREIPVYHDTKKLLRRIDDGERR